MWLALHNKSTYNRALVPASRHRLQYLFAVRRTLSSVACYQGVKSSALSCRTGKTSSDFVANELYNIGILGRKVLGRKDNLFTTTLMVRCPEPYELQRAHTLSGTRRKSRPCFRHWECIVRVRGE